MNDLGTIIAFVGLGNLLGFAQTHKYGSVGPGSAFIGMLVIPAAISLLWRISQSLGWWTIAAFIAASLLVGTLNAVYMRKHGRASLFLMQPVLGVTFLASAVVSWFL